MPRYLIRREVPGAGSLSPGQLHTLAAKSNAVIAQLGEGLQWVQSYVTGDRLFCVYVADDEQKIREHARIGGFPCDEISRVAEVIDPVTGED